MEDLLYLYRGPFGISAIVLIVLNSVLIVLHAYRTVFNRDVVRKLFDPADNILLVSFLLLFATFLTPAWNMWRASNSIASSGTGDPAVILGGLLLLFIPIFINLLFCSLFFIFWFLLHTAYRLRIPELMEDGQHTAPAMDAVETRGS